MTSTISKSRSVEIIEKIHAGDTVGISFDEYIQMSFLALMGGEDLHYEKQIMYGGNLFLIHACVNEVVPAAQPMEVLERMQ